jgi:hypothetical protein
MKKIETPLTWALGIISILLITLISSNSTVKDYNLGNASANNNNDWNLVHEHKAKESTDFSLLKTYGVWGDESCNSAETISQGLIDSLEDTFNLTNNEAKEFLQLESDLDTITIK